MIMNETIKFPTEYICRIFQILKINRMVPFSNLFMGWPSYYNHYYCYDGSANFLGLRAGWAPKELAAGQTGEFYVKNLTTVD